jgi:O-antigen/teichoic acid export membrane protein
MGYSISVTPVAIACAIGIFYLTDKTESIDVLALFLFIAAETIFCLPQQMLSRFLMAEFQVKPLLLANVLSPAIRATALITLAIPGYQVASAALYLISQVAITFALIKISKTVVQFSFFRSKSFLKSLRVGIPNWLSGLGVTALDNLAILFIASYLGAESAANLILVIRVFGVASVPMHSVASVKFAAGLKSKRTEIQITLITGISASALGCLALAIMDILFLGGKFELLRGAGALFLFPFLRTCTTFIGNYFTLLEKPWIRVWSGISGIVTLALSFSLLSNYLAIPDESLNSGSLSVVLAESVMVGVLCLRLFMLRHSSKYLA